ncbi:hypothetical protein ACOSQ2_003800 [Xanthoceras sorbifolium]
MDWKAHQSTSPPDLALPPPTSHPRRSLALSSSSLRRQPPHLTISVAADFLSPQIHLSSRHLLPQIHLAISVAPRHLSPHLSISVAADFLSPQIHLSSRHDAICHRRYSLAADSPHHLCCSSPSVIAVRRFTDHLGFTAESSRRGKLFVKLG